MGKMTTRRKLAISTWSAPREGNIYGKLTLDVTRAIAYLDHVRDETGEKVTITHLVGKALADSMASAPSLNGRIIWGRFVPFETVAVTFLVALEEGADLGKVKLDKVDEMSVVEIARALRERATALKGGKDPEFEKSKGLLRLLPTWLIGPILNMTSFITSGLGWNFGGVSRFPFGSCIITSVGMLGFDEGYAPPTPFARVPVLMLIGAVRDQLAIADGGVVIQKHLTVTATIDHRFIDGFQLGQLAKVFHRVVETPWLIDGLDEPPASVLKADPVPLLSLPSHEGEE